MMESDRKRTGASREDIIRDRVKLSCRLQWSTPNNWVKRRRKRRIKHFMKINDNFFNLIK